MIAIFFALIICTNAMSYQEITENKQFWDQLQIKSILNNPSTYNVYAGEKVCFTCPIGNKMFSELFAIESRKSNTPLIGPPKLPIKWTSYISAKTVNLCSNNTKQTTNDILLDLFKLPASLDIEDSKLEYTCENDQLCLINSKHNYPEDFTCVLPYKSLGIKLNVLVNYKLLVGEMYDRFIGR